eukprot:TRINITY_DN2621_c1_g1_i1.p1 TRINITY_DN2621_c1_g1~~TRINITY_DN2621_c1_g1_i1.p1  ORF type:complete len:670 (-),score=188.18 TRINITY_DN2621_c1_g1_i1:1162-3171(-)
MDESDMKETTTEDNEEITINDNEQWELIYTDTKNLKSKSSSSFDSTLKKPGVYTVQIKVLNRIAIPGRNITTNITLYSSQKKELFKDEKILYPSISKVKQEFNTWFLFIPIEENTIDSILSISYKSNSVLKSIEISNVIRYLPGCDREENIKIIEDYKLKNAKFAEFTPFQVAFEDKMSNTLSKVNLTKTQRISSSPKELPKNDERKHQEISERNTKSKNVNNNSNDLSELTLEDESLVSVPKLEVSQPNLTLNKDEYVLLDRKKPVKIENNMAEKIKEEEDNFQKKVVFEDINCNVSGVNKYTKTIHLSPGIYTLQLDINNKFPTPRRSLELNYRIYTMLDEKMNMEDFIEQNLIEKFSQKGISLHKKNSTFLKTDICVPIDDCTIWLKLEAPILVPIKVDIKLVQTKKLEKSELIKATSNPLKQIGDEKKASPIKKNIWSVQKTLAFKKTETFEIDLTPGTYNFFVSKLDKLGGPLRNFKCNISMFNEKKKSEDHQPTFIKNIWSNQQIGEGQNSAPEASVEFECDLNCVLQVRLDGGIVVAPISFYARLQKLTKFNLKTLQYEGPTLFYYLCIFLGGFVTLKYIWIIINFIASFSIFSLNFELPLLVFFIYWVVKTDQVGKIKAYFGKMDEMKMKSRFEKLKTLMKHGKQSEQERKLELLNRKFDN